MDIGKSLKRVHFLDSLLLNTPNRIEIMVMGAGGTGSRLVNNLARINMTLRGLGKTELAVTLYDDDIVENNNIGRQQFYNEDIGRNKADAIIERINYAYELDWVSIPRKWCNKNILFDEIVEHEHCHIYITCVDNIRTRKELSDNFYRIKGEKGKYWMDIGNGKDYGQVILSYHGNDKNCIAMRTLNDISDGQFNKMKDKKDDPSCSLAVSLGKQSLFINSILAEYAGDMLFRLLSDYSIDYNGIFINLQNHEVNKILL